MTEQKTPKATRAAKPRAGISRRQFLRSTGAAAGVVLGSGAITGFPYVMAKEPITLRYLGTAVNQHKEIADKVKADLGINLLYIPVTSDDVVKRAVTQPNSFDLLDSEYWMLKNIVPSGNLQGMDTKRIKYFDEIVPIFTKGTFEGREVSLQGTAPIKVTYLEGKNATTFSKTPSRWMTLIPTVYNADTLGIRPDLVGQPIHSWKELLDPRYRGKASILNIPSIGIMDAAMVVEAMGKHTYADKGNMTRPEIDLTLKVMTEAKRAGQFRAFWSDFNESVNLMASGEVVIQSMWSPAVTKVRSMGIPCKYQPLKEGYRGWGAGFGLPKTLHGKKLDASYEFINWFLSGWAGAFLNRQGYYAAVLETAKKYMKPYEWDYWMLGKPAAHDIYAPDGTLMEKAGTIRDGGSFSKRMNSIACWNSVMDENRYMVRKWNEFIAA